MWRLLLVFAVLLFGFRAEAKVSLCLDVSSQPVDEGFEKLVRSELARHPSHSVVQQDCDSRLLAELFRLDKGRFLTVRIDGEVPLRFAVDTNRELEQRLSEGISRVLLSDPAYLAEDPARLSSTERAVRTVLVHGNNNYRLAFVENIARSDSGLSFAPGVAFEFAREAGHFGALARSVFAYGPEGVRGDERSLQMMWQLEAGVLYDFAPRAATSAYAALGAGALLLRFQGRTVPDDPRSVDSLTATGAMISLRAGVRFLRTYDFDCDVFGALVAPLFATRNADGVLFGESGVYTPIAQIGLGVGF